jgi:hypothetical protein
MERQTRASAVISQLLFGSDLADSDPNHIGQSGSWSLDAPG